MDKTLTEVFGEFTYSQRLTYEDLLTYEQQIMEDLDRIFLDAGAEYLDFTPLGDILKLQCGFESHDLDLFREMAGKIVLILPKGIRGRMLCLEKSLNSCHIFWLKKDEWQEYEQIIPIAAPADTPVHRSKGA